MLPIASSPRSSTKYVRNTASPSRMNALVPCHSSTPKSASKSSVIVNHGHLPAHALLQPRDVRLRRARGEHERGVAGVQVGDVGDLVGHHGAADAGVLGPAVHPGLEERAVDDQLATPLEQVEQARLARRAPRTRSPCPPPATASVGARRPARRGRGSAPSPSPAALARRLPLLGRDDRWCVHCRSFLHGRPPAR